MEHIKELEILKGAISILDKNSDAIVSSESEIVFNEDNYDYLMKHINKVLSSEELKYGVIEGEYIKKKKEDFFSGEINITTLSRKLGNRLFSLMKEEEGINSCNLVLLSLTSNIGKIIGIFKLDYIKNYISNIDVKEEKLNIDINWKCNSLPAINGKMNKAAFILEEEKEFHLYILDSKGTEKEDYFRDFLESKILENDRDLTKKLIKASKAFVKESLDDDLEENLRVTNQLFKKIKQGSSIDIEETAEELFSDSEKAIEFKNYLQNEGLQNNIQLDNEYSEKKLKRIRIKIDKDIDLYLSEDSYDDKDRFEVVKNGDGYVSVLIKNVKKLEEK